MPDRQGLLVSAHFISFPSGIHEFRSLARFDGQAAVPLVRLKRRKKIAPSSWPDAKGDAPAFIRADRVISNHLSEYIVGMIHDRLETRGSIVARRRAFAAFADHLEAVVLIPDVAADERELEPHHHVPTHRHDVALVPVGRA